MTREPTILGIDLGGTSIKAIAVSPTGALLAESNEPFVDSEMEWAAKIRTWIREMQDKLPADSVTGIGLSAPGLAAADGFSIACMPGRLRGLEGLNWSEYLGFPSPIPVLNDAHAALLGEVWRGAAQGLQNVFMLTLGTGVGGAAMVDGRLLRGHLGRAGHLGHVSLNSNGPPDVCGMPGSLEVSIGNCTIRERTDGRFGSTMELVRAHLAGDAEASRVWLKSIRDLACAVGSMINVLDPEAVIIGGGIARCGPALFGPLEKALDEVEWRPLDGRVKIVPAQLGDLAGAYGAAWQVRHGHIRLPISPVL
jgi:glucokinase